MGVLFRFAFLVPPAVAILVVERLEVGDCLRHHDGFAAGEILQLAECHDAGLAADWQHRVHPCSSAPHRFIALIELLTKTFDLLPKVCLAVPRNARRCRLDVLRIAPAPRRSTIRAGRV